MLKHHSCPSVLNRFKTSPAPIYARLRPGQYKVLDMMFNPIAGDSRLVEGNLEQRLVKPRF